MLLTILFFYHRKKSFYKEKHVVDRQNDSAVDFVSAFQHVLSALAAPFQPAASRRFCWTAKAAENIMSA
jgi:hypothetical protein